MFDRLVLVDCQRYKKYCEDDYGGHDILPDVTFHNQSFLLLRASSTVLAMQENNRPSIDR
jgi:hypothetical protein